MNNLMSFGTIKSWVEDILFATTDYNLTVDLVDVTRITAELMDCTDIDNDIVTGKINKQLASKGCTYDNESCVWNRPEDQPRTVKVLVTEILQRIVDVELKEDMTPNDAINTVRKQYESEEIVLDSSDYADTLYYIYEE